MNSQVYLQAMANDSENTVRADVVAETDRKAVVSLDSTAGHAAEVKVDVGSDATQSHDKSDDEDDERYKAGAENNLEVEVSRPEVSGAVNRRDQLM